jgi:hypothetical protein
MYFKIFDRLIMIWGIIIELILLYHINSSFKYFNIVLLIISILLFLISKKYNIIYINNILHLLSHFFLTINNIIIIYLI